MGSVLDVLTAISAVVVILGGGFAAFQLWLMTRQGHRDFESLYVQRYWTLMDRLGSREPFGSHSATFKKRDRATLIAYVQLCEDEADMYEAGRITRATWNIWKSGIDAMLKLPAVGQILDDSPPGAFETLKRYRLTGKLKSKYPPYIAIARGL
ncbi:hypothetical protein [Agromyces sp. Marseille-Q5079]|uniref:hypothetical protein n=1 Tax=Agromyces sp. Marseille-Q5079 TaxID=3439059 RepID=UPI003D9CBD6E